jgi:secondary thiamine-phosphate synthase enzyme
MTFQHQLTVHTRGRAWQDITDEITRAVARSGIQTGIAHVFVRHTSCSLCLTENADPAVREDLERLAARWAPDGDSAYAHNMEGDDDMAAHARTLLAGTAVTVPVGKGRLLLGTWQGIYLWEHRAQAHVRQLVVTVTG